MQTAPAECEEKFQIVLRVSENRRKGLAHSKRFRHPEDLNYRFNSFRGLRRDVLSVRIVFKRSYKIEFAFWTKDHEVQMLAEKTGSVNILFPRVLVSIGVHLRV